MILIYIVLGFIAIFILELLNGLREIDHADARTIHYFNTTNIVPDTNQKTLTGSLIKRFNQFYGTDDDLLSTASLDILVHDKNSVVNNPNIAYFYKNFLKTHVHKLSRTYFFNDEEDSLEFLSINSAWSLGKPYTNIALNTLKDEKLYGLMNHRKSHHQEWKHCFYQFIEGAIEAASYNIDYGNFVAGFQNITNNTRFIVHYDYLKCSSDNILEPAAFKTKYCSTNNSVLCNSLHNLIVEPQNAFYPDKWKLTENSNRSHDYDFIPVEETSNIVNIAATDDIIAYTVSDSKFKVKCLFKDNTGTWIPHSLDYPILSKEHRIHQNLGLQFIINSSKGEKQLLIVDLVNKDKSLHLVYFLYKFVSGKSILNDPEIRAHYKVENIEEIEPSKIYGSIITELGRREVSHELTAIDVLNTASLPKTIVKNQPDIEFSLVVSLQKYVMIIINSHVSDKLERFQIYDFEEQNYRIKSVDISDDGAYLAFLTYNLDEMEIFIYQVPTYEEDDQLYLVNFDYSLDPEKGNIKDIKLSKNIDDEPILLVLMESGEVISFSIHFGKTSLGMLRNSLVSGNLDIFSLLSLFAIVLMFIFVKLFNTLGLQITLRQPPAPPR